MDVGKINRWVWVFCMVWMSILAGCATTRPGAAAVGSTGAAPQVTVREDGPTVERHLRARFAETFDGCKSASGALWPTFMCSGILMRGTGDYGEFRPWNPKPGSDVAFVWLRQDSNFRGSWKTNGFIFLPKFYADKFGDHSIYINCAFVADAYTWIRSQRGCGPTNSYPAESAPCDKVGVTTAEQYRDKYEPSNWFDQRICGFTMTQGSGVDTRKGFLEMRRAMRMMGAASFNEWNELVVAEWPQDQANLPLEAFYYIANPSNCATGQCPPVDTGRTVARKDQRSLMGATGRWIPIIRITLASSVDASAAFDYIAGDQAILMP